MKPLEDIIPLNVRSSDKVMDFTIIPELNQQDIMEIKDILCIR